MGIVLNSSAIIAGLLTIAGLFFGLDPFYAFAAAMILYIPIKMLLPFGSKKPVSETGMVTSVAVIGVNYLGYSLTYSLLFGILLGYGYTYFWLFVFPKLFSKSNKKLVNGPNN